MPQRQFPDSLDILIQNATVIDGSGKPAFTGSVGIKDGKLVTSGGRVTGTTAVRSTLEEAIEAAYRLSAGVKFANAYCRSDIGYNTCRKLRKQI